MLPYRDGHAATGGPAPASGRRRRKATANGAARTAECFLQLRNEAGKHQVKGAKRALAHGVAGPAGQFHAVLILGTDEGGKK